MDEYSSRLSARDTEIAELKSQLHIVTVDRDDLGDRDLIGRIEIEAHRNEVIRLNKAIEVLQRENFNYCDQIHRAGIAGFDA